MKVHKICSVPFGAESGQLPHPHLAVQCRSQDVAIPSSSAGPEGIKRFGGFWFPIQKGLSTTKGIQPHLANKNGFQSEERTIHAMQKSVEGHPFEDDLPNQHGHLPWLS